MDKIYVSDVLEHLLDARSVRELVRDEMLTVLEPLPLATSESLASTVKYYGGKCMAYPAVWIVGQYTGMSCENMRSRLRKNNSTVCFSLSTSIADDLIDPDESPAESELMLFYLLLMRCLESNDWSSVHWQKSFATFVTPLIPVFVDAAKHLPLPDDAEIIIKQEALAARRIGNFHGMIASQLAHDSVDCSAIITLARQFGDWCARLDDVIDFDDDASTGRWDTFPVAVAMREDPNLARCSSVPELYSAIRARGLYGIMIESLQRSLGEIAACARGYGSTHLSESLLNATRLLPSTLSPFSPICKHNC